MTDWPCDFELLQQAGALSRSIASLSMQQLLV
eukprot:CAMPEP_0177557206 /NCGR_PEP_ID=MMETSP0369-20130122/69523_1 /TAXON_ID=447022 ORGANISM="Scrippsiella hangoei-like, Strain SHHI-4" /NCGR_SAMPLE_ID=MMETSP0369 /ASSEMBLY_ACC=CAM_ASM_000364 /LENGTH=31 /DNA_ID= /DNA_START= /DNA_END= /DNA_ORIENTATION=